MLRNLRHFLKCSDSCQMQFQSQSLSSRAVNFGFALQRPDKSPYWEFEQRGDNSCVLYVLLFTVLISIVNWHFVTPRWQACHSTVLMPLLSLICLLVNTRPAPDQGALFLVIGPSLSVCLCGSICVRIHSPVNKWLVRPWKRPSLSCLISPLGDPSLSRNKDGDRSKHPSVCRWH